MAIQTRRLPRRFSYNGLSLPDIDASLTPEQIRDAYSATYPELTTAAIEGPDVSGDAMHFKFTRAVGTKG